MSAQILQFPGTRTRALGEHQLPAHWSRELRAYYLHATDDGFCPHDRAFAYCEAMAAVPPQRASETDQAYTLRRAQAAISMLPKRAES